MEPLHIETPLLRSPSMARVLGCEVLLKMEALQPVGSFKIRGMGRACQEAITAGARRLVSSSGGNAGYAVAYAGRHLAVPVEVFVPRTTPESMRETIRGEGATVTEEGASWDDAHARAVACAAEQSDTAYIHPFDDERAWRGHASLIHEVAARGEKPDVVVVSVGGGGLMIGLLQGMHAVGWTDVPVVAVETEGAASFARSVEAHELVTLDSIESIATTLGARRVASEALRWVQRHEILTWQVSDRSAVEACLRFADDHRVLVEPACGASLALAYESAQPLRGRQRVLIVVCGGAAANRELLEQWTAQTRAAQTRAERTSS